MTSALDRLAAFREAEHGASRSQGGDAQAAAPAKVEAIGRLQAEVAKLTKLDRIREERFGPVPQRALHQLRCEARILLEDRAELLRCVAEAEHQAADARAKLVGFDAKMLEVDALLWERGAKLAPASTMLAGGDEVAS